MHVRLVAYRRAIRANQGSVTGLPTLRVSIAKQFRQILGLVRKGTTVDSKSNPGSYGLGTIGDISTRTRVGRPDPEGDSVEELILGKNIMVTKTFDTRVRERDEGS